MDGLYASAVKLRADLRGILAGINKERADSVSATIGDRLYHERLNGQEALAAYALRRLDEAIKTEDR